MTAPAYAWPASTTGPSSRSRTRSTAAMSSAREVSGNGAATTVMPAAFSGPITLLQLDPSAQAPCTSTTPTWSAGIFPPFESGDTEDVGKCRIRLAGKIRSRTSGVGRAKVGEVGQQVVVRLDGLGGGPPVDHEDHAGREDVVGHDPAVGVVGRPGAVVMQDVGQQRVGRGAGFVRWIAVLLQGSGQRLQVVLHVIDRIGGVELVFDVICVEDRVERRVAFTVHRHEHAVAAQAGCYPCPDARPGAKHVVGYLHGDGEDVGTGEGVGPGPLEVSLLAVDEPVQDAVGVGEEGVAACADEQSAWAGLDRLGGGVEAHGSGVDEHVTAWFTGSGRRCR